MSHPRRPATQWIALGGRPVVTVRLLPDPDPGANADADADTDTVVTVEGIEFATPPALRDQARQPLACRLDQFGEY